MEHNKISNKTANMTTHAVGAFPRAVTVQKAASEQGFDWPEIAGVLDKVAEELDELRDAVAHKDASHAYAELGDLLFAAVSVARFLNANPETCLHAATTRFEARMKQVTQIAEKDGISLQSCTPDRLDMLWEQAKALMHQQLEKDLDKPPGIHAD